MEDLELSRTKPNIIVAYTKEQRIIGHNKSIPWPRITADMQFLKFLTTQNRTALIMGRNTFESIGRPLKDRVNIVLTSRKINNDEIIQVANLKDAIQYCKDNKLVITIFGGEMVYKEALLMNCELFCTIIDENFEGNVVFPDCEYELKDISEKVNNLLYTSKSKWKFENGIFYENNVKYKFYKNK